MREQLEKRLQELKAEFDAGQKKLTEIEAQANNVRNTLLRISGAIQVLEEELAKRESSNGKPSEHTGEQVAEAAVAER